MGRGVTLLPNSKIYYKAIVIINWSVGIRTDKYINGTKQRPQRLASVRMGTKEGQRRWHCTQSSANQLSLLRVLHLGPCLASHAKRTLGELKMQMRKLKILGQTEINVSGYLQASGKAKRLISQNLKKINHNVQISWIWLHQN